MYPLNFMDAQQWTMPHPGGGIVADPRWKLGMIRSSWHKPPTHLDSPTLYGWQPVDVNDEGYTIFALGAALMRATMPRDRLPLRDKWIVFLNGKVFASYGGDLAAITEDVRKAANEIPFDGQLYPQAIGSEIGEKGL